MKKLLSILLSVFMIMSAFTMNVFADGTPSYDLNNNKLTISGNGTIESLSSIDNVKNSLGTILEIVIEEDVTNAVENAFSGIGSADTKVALTLPNGWQGAIPDDDGNWYGAKVNLTNEITAVAQIGEAKYKSLKDAVASISNNTETTITMIADETIKGNAGITINNGKNIIVDLNGHTIKNAVNEDKASQIFENKGTLTIKDNSDTNKNGTGSGLLINGIEDGTNPGEWWSTPLNNYASNVITNLGTLTIESGKLENTAHGSICYAVDNNSNERAATLNVNGGLLVSCNTVVRLFCQPAGANTVNMTGGMIDGYTGIWVQLPGGSDARTATLNISGGTIKGTSYSYYDYSYGNPFTNVNYNLSSGTFDGDIFSYGANFNITGGTFNGEIYIKQTNPSTIKVSGGRFKSDVRAYGDNPSTEFIHYSEEHNPVFAINTYEDKEKTYNCYWTTEIASPYIPVYNTNEETKAEYPYTIGIIYQAQIKDTKYPTLKDAINAANEGDTIELLEDIVLQESLNVNKNQITINGKNHSITADPYYDDFAKYKVGGTNQKYGSLNLLSVSGNNVVIENLTVDVKDYRGMSCITTTNGKDVTYKNITYKGRGSGHYYGYGTGTILFDNCDIETKGYGIHFSAEKDTYELEIKDSKVHGWNSFGGASGIKAVNTEFYGADDSDNGVKKNGLLAKFRPYSYADLIDCKFSVDYLVENNESDFCGVDTGKETYVQFFNCSIINNDGTTNNEHDIYEIVDYSDDDCKNNSLFLFCPDSSFDNNYEKLIVVTRKNDISVAGYKTVKLSNVKDTYDEKDNVYTFEIRKATDNNKVVITQTDDNVPEYYEKVTELQDAIDNVTYANQQKFDNNQTVSKTTITVTNGTDSANGIKAEIDDKVIIVADTNTGNDVKADPGYKMNDPQTEGTKTTYTATALKVGFNETDTDTKTGVGNLAGKESPTIAEKAVAGASDKVKDSAKTVNDTENNTQLVEIVCKAKDETDINNNFSDVLASRGIHQGTAAKALNDSGIVTVTNDGSSGIKASSVSVFVRTYYDTKVKEDKTSETNKSYSLDITPMYQAYASTVNNITAMVAEGDPTASPENPVNAVKIGESLPVDCTGKTINLKIQLPTGFITSTSQKVYVIHTLADGITKNTYDTTVTNEGEQFFIEFTNPDGFSVFEFTLEKPTPTPTPTPGNTPSYKVPNTGVEGYTNNNSLLKVSSLSLLAIGTYIAIKKKKDNK